MQFIRFDYENIETRSSDITIQMKENTIICSLRKFKYDNYYTISVFDKDRKPIIENVRVVQAVNVLQGIVDSRVPNDLFIGAIPLDNEFRFVNLNYPMLGDSFQVAIGRI